MAMVNMKNVAEDALREMLIHGQSTFRVEFDQAGNGITVEPKIHEGCNPRVFASNNAEWETFLDVGIEKYIDGFRITEPADVYPEVTTIDEVGACAMNYMMCLALGGGRFS